MLQMTGHCLIVTHSTWTLTNLPIDHRSKYPHTGTCMQCLQVAFIVSTECNIGSDHKYMYKTKNYPPPPPHKKKEDKKVKSESSWPLWQCAAAEVLGVVVWHWCLLLLHCGQRGRLLIRLFLKTMQHGGQDFCWESQNWYFGLMSDKCWQLIFAWNQKPLPTPVSSVFIFWRIESQNHY